MSTKLSPLWEKTLMASLSSAAGIIGDQLYEEGVPTTEIMNNLIIEALGEAGAALSQKGADMLTVEALKASSNPKVNLGTFLGMVKGRCVVLGMRARNVYDLELLLEAMAPAVAFKVSKEDAMKAVKPVIAALPTKISAALASYMSRGSVSKSAVLEAFSEFDEQLVEEILAIVTRVTGDVVDALGKLTQG